MFSRHDLVWLSAEGWREAGATAPEHAATLARWQQGRWPLVVRRNDADAAIGVINLGLALPPDAATGQKTRIALQVRAADVVKTTAPLPLRAVLPALTEAWRRQLLAFAEESVGLTFRVYGSVALQALTGLAYVTPASDIDLLFLPSTEQQLRAGLALLKKHGEHLPLDGEVVFPQGQAVSWKEWTMAEANDARVLIKEHGAVRLLPVRLLLSTLRTA